MLVGGKWRACEAVLLSGEVAASGLTGYQQVGRDHCQFMARRTRGPGREISVRLPVIILL